MGDMADYYRDQMLDQVYEFDDREHDAGCSGELGWCRCVAFDRDERSLAADAHAANVRRWTKRFTMLRESRLWVDQNRVVWHVAGSMTPEGRPPIRSSHLRHLERFLSGRGMKEYTPFGISQELFEAAYAVVRDEMERRGLECYKEDHPAAQERYRDRIARNVKPFSGGQPLTWDEVANVYGRGARTRPMDKVFDRVASMPEYEVRDGMLYHREATTEGVRSNPDDVWDFLRSLRPE